MSVNPMMFLGMFLAEKIKGLFSFRWVKGVFSSKPKLNEWGYVPCRWAHNKTRYVCDECPGYPTCPDYEPEDKPKPVPQRHITIG